MSVAIGAIDRETASGQKELAPSLLQDMVGQEMRQGHCGISAHAPRRPGTHRTLHNGLKLKEVVSGDGECDWRQPVKRVSLEDC